MGYEALDGYCRVEAMYDVATEVDVFFEGELWDGDFAMFYLAGKSRSADELQLVKFNGVGMQGVDGIDGGEHHVARFTRESEYEMKTDVEPPCMSHFYGSLSALPSVTAIYES